MGIQKPYPQDLLLKKVQFYLDHRYRGVDVKFNVYMYHDVAAFAYYVTIEVMVNGNRTRVEWPVGDTDAYSGELSIPDLILAQITLLVG